MACHGRCEPGLLVDPAPPAPAPPAPPPRVIFSSRPFLATALGEELKWENSLVTNSVYIFAGEAPAGWESNGQEQKRPIKEQKRPIKEQKRPIKEQKRPINIDIPARVC